MGARRHWCARSRASYLARSSGCIRRTRREPRYHARGRLRDGLVVHFPVRGAFSGTRTHESPTGSPTWSNREIMFSISLTNTLWCSLTNWRVDWLLHRAGREILAYFRAVNPSYWIRRYIERWARQMCAERIGKQRCLNRQTVMKIRFTPLERVLILLINPSNIVAKQSNSPYWDVLIV